MCVVVSYVFVIPLAHLLICECMRVGWSVAYFSYLGPDFSLVSGHVWGGQLQICHTFLSLSLSLGRPGMSDVSLLSGISGLSFDFPFLSPLLFFSA